MPSPLFYRLLFSDHYFAPVPLISCPPRPVCPPPAPLHPAPLHPTPTLHVPSSTIHPNHQLTPHSVKAILDANRNALMLLDLKFSIGTLGIGSGAFIAALYGMNLKNFLEESDYGFFGVSAWSFVFAGVVCGYGLSKLRRVQRVSMWGEGGVAVKGLRGGRTGGRGNWREIAGGPMGDVRRNSRGRVDGTAGVGTTEMGDVGLGAAGLPVIVKGTEEKR